MISSAGSLLVGNDKAHINVKKTPRYVTISYCIAENKFFVALTTMLTMYALTADDFRAMYTQAPQDGYFNAMIWILFTVFSFEVLISCLGKSDYYLGFFFYLDVLSTASLLLDLTYLNSLINGSSNLKTGRSARVGAKAGRVVRVLRLVRILKLYKAYYEARQLKKAREGKAPGDDDWDDEELLENGMKEEEENQESQVGKKLSEMTTRRVIILILTMLTFLPLMTADSTLVMPTSAEYGANQVYQKFQAAESQNATSTASFARSAYEKALLNYAFYHNWFVKQYPDKFCPWSDSGCPDTYYAFVFWIGVAGDTAAAVNDKASKAKLDQTLINSFNAAASRPSVFYTYGSMPTYGLQQLGSDWTTSCQGTNGSPFLKGISLISEAGPDVTTYPIRCPEQLRLTETLVFTPVTLNNDQYHDWHFEFYFDIRSFTFEESAVSLQTTVFVLALLLASSLIFTSDANRLIVHPVEKMITRVQAIRDNPLIALKMADDEFKAEEVAKAKRRRHHTACLDKILDIMQCKLFAQANSEPMEMVVLEKTIIKLGSLLALGFGEAGANIISQNMKGSDSAGVNAMVPGIRVDCIIGFCRVLNFSTATEVLQAKVMTFVNQIAEIIHGVVDEFHGAPNKNSGEHFLVIWRAPPDAEPSTYRSLSDMSIVTFSKILGAIHRSALLADYRTHPGLVYRLGKGSRVNLSFGVHAGWAIEGAVGSEFKIDASYVSPHVSIATSVELCTQIYGVSFIVAQSVMERCSAGIKSKCRHIDRVAITGSQQPMDLFCVDLDWTQVQVEDTPPPQITWNTRNRFRARQFLEAQKNLKSAQDFVMEQAFDTDPLIQVMRERYSVTFFQLFNMGYQNYSQGEWQVARRMLSETRFMCGFEDGPSTALLLFMETYHDYEAPKDWMGVRDIGDPASYGHMSNA